MSYHQQRFKTSVSGFISVH